MPEGNLKPEEVASLDPYNRRRVSSAVQAEELIKTVKPESIQQEETAEENLDVFRENLIEEEAEAWKRVLGDTSALVIKPPPKVITPDLVSKLNKMGLELRYIPQLAIEEHPNSGELNSLYPNWRRFEDLLPGEIGKWSNIRNLKDKFWEQYRSGKVSLDHGGFWVAVEEGKQTNRPLLYNDPQLFPLSPLLDITTRKNSYADVQRILEKKKPEILKAVDLPIGNAVIRLPSALEYNLLMNRDGISALNTYYDNNKCEWTSTKVRTMLGVKNFVMGFSFQEGASEVGEKDPDKRDYYTEGFRILLEIKDV